MERRDYVLNERTYSILLPSVMQAMPLCTKTAVIVSPLSGVFADIRTLISPDSTTEVKLATVLSKFGELLSQLDPEKIEGLLSEAVNISGLCCNGKQIFSAIEFERHFSDKREEVYQIRLWTLWECVKDFFPQLKGFIPNQ